MRSFWIILSVFFGVCAIYLLIILQKTDGDFTYILDDAYIHLSVAKNFIEHGVWGITKYHFSSTSSSPLYTFVLSVLIGVFGDFKIIPLIFNIGVGVLIVYLLYRYFKRYFKNGLHLILIILFVLFFSVIHVQIFTGMEHLLHVLLIVINVYAYQRWSTVKFINGKYAITFFISLIFLGLVRFESMFYIVSVAFVLFLLRYVKLGLATLFFGFLPIAVFCYFNYQQTGYFFPNSVVVKGMTLEFGSSFFYDVLQLLKNNILLNRTFYKIAFVPLVLSLYILIRDFKVDKNYKNVLVRNSLLICWILTCFLNFLFGRFNSVFRYEAYLLVSFCMIILPKLRFLSLNSLKSEKMLATLIALNLVLCLYKMEFSNRMLLNGSANIYEQQIQSARFLNKYYNNSKVVANDIGAICYYTDIQLFDVMGLGSKEMVRFKINDRPFDDASKKFIKEYANKHNYKLAIVYDDWLYEAIPENWRKVGTAKIDNVITAASNTVSFYAIDPNIKEQLKNNIKNFEWNKNVVITTFD